MKPSPISTPLIAWIDMQRVREPPVELAIPVRRGCRARPRSRPRPPRPRRRRVARLASPRRSRAPSPPPRPRGHSAPVIARCARAPRAHELRRRHRLRHRAADAHHVRHDLHAQLTEEAPAHSARRDARRRLSRARALENVADVVVVVLERAREVARAPAAASLRLRRRPVPRLDRHHLAPILPVLVHEEERDRAAQRLAAPHAREDADAVVLDLHPPAAPIAMLPPRKIRIHVVLEQGQPRGHPLDDRHQPLPMRLPRRQKPNQHFLLPPRALTRDTAAIITDRPKPAGNRFLDHSQDLLSTPTSQTSAATERPQAANRRWPAPLAPKAKRWRYASLTHVPLSSGGDVVRAGRRSQAAWPHVAVALAHPERPSRSSSEPSCVSTRRTTRADDISRPSAHGARGDALEPTLRSARHCVATNAKRGPRLLGEPRSLLTSRARFATGYLQPTRSSTTPAEGTSPRRCHDPGSRTSESSPWSPRKRPASPQPPRPTRTESPRP